MEKAVSLRDEGNAALKAGKLEDAERLYTESLNVIRGQADACWNAGLIEAAARTYTNRAQLMRKQKRHIPAAGDFERGRRLFQSLVLRQPATPEQIGTPEDFVSAGGQGGGVGGPAGQRQRRARVAPAAGPDALPAPLLAPAAAPGQALEGEVDHVSASTRVLRSLWLRADCLRSAGRASTARVVFAAALRCMGEDHPRRKETVKVIADLDSAIEAEEAARLELLRQEARTRGIAANAPELAAVKTASKRVAGATSRTRRHPSAAAAGEAPGSAADGGRAIGDPEDLPADDVADDHDDDALAGGEGAAAEAEEVPPIVAAEMLVQARRLPAEQGLTVPAPAGSAGSAGSADSGGSADSAGSGTGGAPIPDAPTQRKLMGQLLRQYRSLGPQQGQTLFLVSSAWWRSWCAWTGYGGATEGSATASSATEGSAAAGAAPLAPAPGSLGSDEPLGAGGAATASDDCGDKAAGASPGASEGAAAAAAGAAAEAAGAGAAPSPPGPVSNADIADRRFRLHGADPEAVEAEVVEDAAAADGVAPAAGVAGAAPTRTGETAEYVTVRPGIRLAGAPLEAAAVSALAVDHHADDADVVAVGEQAWRALCSWHGGGPCLPRTLRDVRTLPASYAGPAAVAGAAPASAPAAARLSPPEGHPSFLALDVYPEARARAAAKARDAEARRAAARAEAGEVSPTGGADADAEAAAGPGAAELLAEGCCPYMPGTTLPAGAALGPDSSGGGGGIPAGALPRSQAEAAALSRWARPFSPLAIPLAEAACTAFAEPPERFAGRGVVGLRNVGNTCFLNSALQCLSACWPLVAWALRGSELQELNTDNVLGTGGVLARELGHTLRMLWTHEDVAKTGGIAPDGLKAALGRFQSQFRGFRQHDAHELLSFLLDGLHEDCNRVLDKPYLAAPEFVPAGGEAALARATWRWYQARNRSVVSACMAGMLRSQLDCPSCGHSAAKFEPFTSLQLPLAQPSGFLLRVTVSLQPRAPAGPASSRRPAPYRCEAGEGLGADAPPSKRGGGAPTQGDATSGLRVASTLLRSLVFAGEPGMTVGEVRLRVARRLAEAEPDLFAAPPGALGGGAGGEDEGVERAAASLASRLLAFGSRQGEVSVRPDDGDAIVPRKTRTGPVAALRFTEALEVVHRQADAEAASAAAEPADGAQGGLPGWAAAEAAAFGDEGEGEGEDEGAPGAAPAGGAAASMLVEVRLLLGSPKWTPGDGVASLSAKGQPLVLAVPRASSSIALRRRIATALAPAFRSDVAVAQLTAAGAAPVFEEAAAAAAPAAAAGAAAGSGRGAAVPGRSSAAHVENLARALRVVALGASSARGAPASLLEASAAAAALAGGQAPGDGITLPVDRTPSADALQLAALPGASVSAALAKPQWVGVGVVVAGPWYDALDVMASMAGAEPGPLARANARTRARVGSAAVSLSDCLRRFAAPERLGKGNEWFCPACKQHVAATKAMSVWSAPDVLCVQLSRFTSHGVLFKSKLSTPVSFPRAGLDLAPAVLPAAQAAAEDEAAAAAGLLPAPGAAFGGVGGAEMAERVRCEGEGGAASGAAAGAASGAAASAGDVQPAAAPGEPGAAPSPASRLYDLFGVVRHHGGMMGGHYTAHANRYVARYGAAPEGCGGGGTCPSDPLALSGPSPLAEPRLGVPEEADAAWHCFDDSRTGPASSAEAQSPDDAYLLFFRRRGLVTP
ncbi:hypothetical protein FNF27_05029 [Cafeteria roenbergensis]|uniref:ubiquitinyl hydrolase 1 n=5 Tax=Cafeteria roenbergensis TaxID=33653 RepID=A0A5A8E8N0_CAFRO|nr:hypothetical protein FNF27_05029 [Cafeteria roenbergensis]